MGTMRMYNFNTNINAKEKEMEITITSESGIYYKDKFNNKVRVYSLDEDTVNQRYHAAHLSHDEKWYLTSYGKGELSLWEEPNYFKQNGWDAYNSESIVNLRCINVINGSYTYIHSMNENDVYLSYDKEHSYQYYNFQVSKEYFYENYKPNPEPTKFDMEFKEGKCEEFNGSTFRLSQMYKFPDISKWKDKYLGSYVQISTPKSCNHKWKTIELFTSSIEECIHCGCKK